MCRKTNNKRKERDEVRYRTQYTLRTWRAVRGLTLNEASKRIGVSVPTLIAWEKDKTIPMADKIPKIEQAYNIKWSDDVIFPAKNTKSN